MLCEPFAKAKGRCPCCNSPVLAKCGSKILHHWAHKSLKHCDIWWENETLWHREWKSHFPKDWQEFVQFDEKGEKHIADIKTASGMVVEFQNSPISADELNSREQFYKTMVWVVNAKKFQSNFAVSHKLPDPKSKLAEEVRFRDGNFLLFYRLSENRPGDTMVLVHSARNIMNEIDSSHNGHYLYRWSKPRTVWYTAKSDVYLDFGTNHLFKFMNFDDRGLHCVQKVLKSNFIKLMIPA